MIFYSWAKFLKYRNSSIIGSHILTLFSEDLILFYNLQSNDDKVDYYRACDKEYGDGISCLCGHKIDLIFAFAEKCLKSRILIMKYPDFERIQSLPGTSFFFSLSFVLQNIEYK